MVDQADETETLDDGEVIEGFQTGDVAERLGVSRQTVKNWVDAGLLHPDLVSGLGKRPSWVFDVDEVERFAKQREAEQRDSKDQADRVERARMSQTAMSVASASQDQTIVSAMDGTTTNTKMLVQSLEQTFLTTMNAHAALADRHLESIMDRWTKAQDAYNRSEANWKEGYLALVKEICGVSETAIKRLDAAEARTEKLEKERRRDAERRESLLSQEMEREETRKDNEARRQAFKDSMSKLTKMGALAVPHILKAHGVDVPPAVMAELAGGAPPAPAKVEQPSSGETPTAPPTKGACALLEFVGELKVAKYSSLLAELGDKREMVEELLREGEADKESPEKMQAFCKALMGDSTLLGKLSELFSQEESGKLLTLAQPYLG